MPKRKQNLAMDEFFKKSGFLRHKQSYRGVGYYFSVGGYDITYDDAVVLYKHHLKSNLAGTAYVLQAILNMHNMLKLDLKEQMEEQLAGLTKQIEEIK